jgi:hypothetical protein
MLTLQVIHRNCHAQDLTLSMVWASPMNGPPTVCFYPNGQSNTKPSVLMGSSCTVVVMLSLNHRAIYAC